MFKYALQAKLVKLAKPEKTDSTTEEALPANLDEINTIVKEQVLHTAIVVVGGIAATMILNAVCQIAVNNLSPTKD